jgi:hypothetical protein
MSGTPVVLPVSLRDYFAGLAIKDILPKADLDNLAEASKTAYAMADAMLIERDKPQRDELLAALETAVMLLRQSHQSPTTILAAFFHNTDALITKVKECN